MLEIFSGAVDTAAVFSKWENYAKERNLGALCVFVGLVRSEQSEESSDQEYKGEESSGEESKNEVSGLFFEIYRPILDAWFETWQERANKSGVTLFMAHSMGEVKAGSSSYMAGIASRNRRAALEIYADFIEDFKHNAPIWKFDIVGDKRVYAASRSHAIAGAGLLAK